jgi:nuclear cap-binding protein subunit 1
MAFITGALDKEIRLSFAQRIKGTLPEPYQTLIPEGKENETPEFKYTSDCMPFLPSLNFSIISTYLYALFTI